MALVTYRCSRCGRTVRALAGTKILVFHPCPQSQARDGQSVLDPVEAAT